MYLNKLTYPGGKWRKIDFHVHTLASNDYHDKKATEEDILKTAMAANLDCIVITDHNSGLWIDKLKNKIVEIKSQPELPAWFRNLVIFPGVEITVADSNGRNHILAVFDTECDGNTITSLLGACGIYADFGDDLNTYTKKSLSDVISIIKNAGGIAIPAHADGPDGFLQGIKTINKALAKNLNDIIAIEFCNLNIVDDYNVQLLNALNNVAKIGGSDAHSPEKIGRHFSWIKMDSPNIKSLQLALMDHAYCVKNQTDDPSHTPDIWINKIIIENLTYCGRIPGQPFKLEFSPEFNAVIGGRGSGKSTLIESMRIVLRQDINLNADLINTKNRIDKFINNAAMPDTLIYIELMRGDKQYRINWRYNPDTVVLEDKDVNGCWRPTEAGNIQERFPVSVFSQKQIEELASNPGRLLNLIDKTPAVNRQKWSEKWENVKSEYMQLNEKKRNLLRKISNESQIKIRLADLENNLEQYEQKGHGGILKNYHNRILQQNALPADDIFNNFAKNITELASDMDLPDFPAHLFSEGDEALPELKEIYERAAIGIENISNNLFKTIHEIELIKSGLKHDVENSNWNKSLLNYKEKYQNLIKEYAQKGNALNLSVYSEWSHEYRQLQQQVNGYNSIKEEIKILENQIAECINQFVSLRESLINRRREFINSVIGENPYVRMELIPFGEKNTLDNDYREILGIDNTFISSILDKNRKSGILYNFYNCDDGAKLLQLLTAIKTDTKNIADGDKDSHPYIDWRFTDKLKNIISNQPVILDRLNAWYPEDLLIVKYPRNPGSGDFHNIENSLSAGQKATAILAFLLSYGNEPLIIDQPEDDLDNELIAGFIINQLHANKARRQIIIATHNPNIVVNGIAELIISLKFTGGQARLNAAGGLGSEIVKDIVCTVMEGGNDAFDRRYNRIRQANNA